MPNNKEPTGPSDSVAVGSRISWSQGDRVTTWIHAAFGGLAGTILLAVMGVSVADVVGRGIFNAPLPGAYEIIQFLMAALIYAALPSVSRQEAHIAIDLLDALTPTAAIPVRQVLVNLVAALCFGVVAWTLWVLAEKTREYGDVTEYLRVPRAPIIYFMSALSAVATIVLVANVFRYIRGAKMPAPGFI